jgi:spore coat polysaccharide biosynthesis protein SpsF
VILAIIQAREASSRLPGKVLMDLNGKPVLLHVIDAVRSCKSVNAIVVATGAGNGAIASSCHDWGVACYQDWDEPESDVLGRFARVVYTFGNVEHVLRVCGDSPLFDSQAADELIAAAVEMKCDYAGYQIGGQPAVIKPTGYFGEVITSDAIKRADKLLAKNDRRREHVTACMYEEGSQFLCHWMKTPTWYAKETLKLAAVDTAEDLKRVKEAVG